MIGIANNLLSLKCLGDFFIVRLPLDFFLCQDCCHGDVPPQKIKTCLLFKFLFQNHILLLYQPAGAGRCVDTYRTPYHNSHGHFHRQIIPWTTLTKYRQSIHQLPAHHHQRTSTTPTSPGHFPGKLGRLKPNLCISPML